MFSEDYSGLTFLLVEKWDLAFYLSCAEAMTGYCQYPFAQGYGLSCRGLEASFLRYWSTFHQVLIDRLSLTAVSSCLGFSHMAFAQRVTVFSLCCFSQILGVCSCT